MWGEIGTADGDHDAVVAVAPFEEDDTAPWLEAAGGECQTKPPSILRGGVVVVVVVVIMASSCDRAVLVRSWSWSSTSTLLCDSAVATASSWSTSDGTVDNHLENGGDDDDCSCCWSCCGKGDTGCTGVDAAVVVTSGSGSGSSTSSLSCHSWREWFGPVVDRIRLVRKGGDGDEKEEDDDDDDECVVAVDDGEPFN